MPSSEDCFVLCFGREVWGSRLRDIAETSLGQFQIFAMPGRSQICLRAGLANTGLFRALFVPDVFQVVGHCWPFLLEYHVKVGDKAF